jgi:aspartyl-tRNA(Asn)/glutamyl-tRNA(Gln) amidotransferase subunit A
MNLREANEKLKAVIGFTDEPMNARLGPLSGLNIGIKGNIAVQGLANSSGSAARHDAIAQSDARVVAQLRAAGANIIGTLNMHEGALGATTDNQTYGRCINPWRDGFSPGGSSGGSGAAIAGGLVDGALGSDTMGSIRLPASYCGVFGYKPSGTLVSQVGVTPLSMTLDQVGPLAKDASTLWAMAKVLGAPEPLVSLAGLKFGVPRDMAPATSPIASLFEEQLAKFTKAGAIIIDVDLGLGYQGSLGLTDVDVILASLLVCEIEGAVEWAPELADPKSGLTEEFRAMLNYGATIGELRTQDAYAKLEKVKAHIRQMMDAKDLSGLLTPTVSHLAFHHDVGPPMDQAYLTQYANIADLPAISVPMGLIDGLPSGLQCIGAAGRDDIVLGVARLFPALSLPGMINMI